MSNAVETILRAEGLLLRPIWLTKAAVIYEAAYSSRREIGPWLEWCHENYRQSETEEFLVTLPQRWEIGESYTDRKSVV